METVSVFLLIIGLLLLGFALGYGVRAYISSRRRARAMHRKAESVSPAESRFTPLSRIERLGMYQDNEALSADVTQPVKSQTPRMRVQ
jgi:hypothetical protein